MGYENHSSRSSEHAPSIIFMDEIDSIGSTRVEGSSGGDSEVQRTMLELLNQLDGFEPKQNIKFDSSSTLFLFIYLFYFFRVIMATNRIDILDSALLRPGRIDRKIEFPAPGEDARLDILKIHSRKMNLTRGINLRKIAEMMPGASGAEAKVNRPANEVNRTAFSSLVQRASAPKRECTRYESVVCT